MRPYKISPGIVYADQWWGPGDLPEFVGDAGPDSGELCELCGKMEPHGVLRNAGSRLFNGAFVCPGDWVVKHPGGYVSRKSTLDFYANYNPVL